MRNLLETLLLRLIPSKVWAKVEALYGDSELRRLTRNLAGWSSDCIIRYPWNSLVGLKEISMGKRFQANRGLFLGAYGVPSDRPKILIGDDILINYDTQITACNRVEIGAGSLLGSRVVITDHGHGDFSREDLLLPPLLRPLRSKGPVIIGCNVWIGAGVVILPGVSLGNNCVVGANAVVTKNFPPNTLIAGNPARAIRTLAKLEG